MDQDAAVDQPRRRLVHRPVQRVQRVLGDPAGAVDHRREGGAVVVGEVRQPGQRREIEDVVGEEVDEPVVDQRVAGQGGGGHAAVSPPAADYATPARRAEVFRRSNIGARTASPPTTGGRPPCEAPGMKHIIAGLALALAIAGCGGSSKKAATPAAATCADAGANTRAQYMATPDADPKVGDIISATITERCSTDGWSADAISCMATATQETGPACAEHSPPAQKQNFGVGLAEGMNGGGDARRPTSSTTPAASSRPRRMIAARAHGRSCETAAMKHLPAGLALALAIGAGAACHGSKAATPTTPPAPALAAPAPTAVVDGASCDVIADHMRDEMVKAAADGDTDISPLVPVFRRVVAERCVADAWPVDARACLATAVDEQLETCAAKLTDAQTSALSKAVEAAFNEALMQPGGDADKAKGEVDGRAPGRWRRRRRSPRRRRIARAGPSTRAARAS